MYIRYSLTDKARVKERKIREKRKATSTRGAPQTDAFPYRQGSSGQFYARSRERFNPLLEGEGSRLTEGRVARVGGYEGRASIYRVFRRNTYTNACKYLAAHVCFLQDNDFRDDG